MNDTKAIAVPKNGLRCNKTEAAEIPTHGLGSRMVETNKHFFVENLLDIMRFNYVVLILLLALMTSAQCQQNAKDWYDKGKALDDQGKHDEAIKAYDEAIRLDPQYADAWYNKGNILYVLHNKYDEAIQAYDEVIKIDPQNDSVWNYKGNALTYQGKYDEAIKAYDRAIEINPHFYDGNNWYRKGLALYELGRYDEAIQAYDEAIKLNSSKPYYWYDKGKALDDQGKYDEAIRAYDEVIKIDPQYADAWNSKGNALSELGRYDEAILCYNTAIEINQNAFFSWEILKLAGIWNGKGNALSELGRYDEAIKCYDTAIGLDPKLDAALSGKELAFKAASQSSQSQVASQQQTTSIKYNPPDNNVPQTSQASSFFSGADNSAGKSMITTDGEDIQPLLGIWHLPGGDITINQDDLDQMERNINSISLKEITPRKIFVYALIKYHHKYKILLPPSAVESGLQNLSERYSILNSTKSEIRAFWAEYMKLDFKDDSEFGTQQGILDDWNLYNIKVDTWRQARLYGIQAPLVIDYAHWENLMNDMTEFGNNVIQRDFESQLIKEGYRAELNAQWAIGQAEYEVWKSQIS
jgi:tetratricopeptide (TPR) repeat protein